MATETSVARLSSRTPLWFRRFFDYLADHGLRACNHATRAKRGIYPDDLCQSIISNTCKLDKLVTAQVGFLAQRRLARGVKLNHAEATVRATRSGISTNR